MNNRASKFTALAVSAGALAFAGPCLAQNASGYEFDVPIAASQWQPNRILPTITLTTLSPIPPAVRPAYKEWVVPLLLTTDERLENAQVVLYDVTYESPYKPGEPYGMSTDLLQGVHTPLARFSWGEPFAPHAITLNEHFALFEATNDGRHLRLTTRDPTPELKPMLDIAPGNYLLHIVVTASNLPRGYERTFKVHWKGNMETFSIVDTSEAP